MLKWTCQEWKICEMKYDRREHFTDGLTFSEISKNETTQVHAEIHNTYCFEQQNDVGKVFWTVFISTSCKIVDACTSPLYGRYIRLHLIFFIALSP